jgi:hypothetical protein
MSAAWTSGVCAACRAPVVVCGDAEKDYLWRCPNAHHEEATYDDEAPWWVLREIDQRTEAQVIADIERVEQRQAEAKAAYNAGDWARFRELVQADVDEAMAKAPKPESSTR